MEKDKDKDRQRPIYVKYQNPLLRVRTNWYRAQSSRSLKYNDKYMDEDKDKDNRSVDKMTLPK